MLRVKRVTLSNFGPFKGKQLIEFPKGDGVIVLFGENGRGKTSFLNAIRFAFYDKVLGRGTEELPLARVLNMEAKRDGEKEFSVTLVFDFEGSEYELTRLGRLDDKGVCTTQNFLKQDGRLLNLDSMKRTLQRVMPEEVSRFFLFDGELLQEYEQLVRETDQSQGIKDAIERILGVPILTNAISHLEDELKEAKKAESTALRRDNATKHLGEALRQMNELQESMEHDLKVLERELATRKNEKMSLESLMKENERAAKLLTTRTLFETEVNNLETEVAQLEQEVQARASEIWKLPLRKRMEDRIASLNQKKDAALAQIEQMFTEATIVALANRSSSEGQCALCETPLPKETRARLTSRGQASDSGSGNPLAEFQTLNARAQSLAAMHSTILSGEVTKFLTRLETLQPRLHAKRIDIQDLNKQLENVDADDLANSKHKLETVHREMALLEHSALKKRAQLANQKDEITEKSKQVGQGRNSGSHAEIRRREICSQLVGVFEGALSQYRDRLRAKVENDATQLFKKFSSEKDFVSLKINENYGLVIVHRTGDEVLRRSAGFEHIVALSLMGALQKNAPLRGPIFMDSPMGRLDGTHKENVTASLPHLSDQVALLVFGAELSQEIIEKQLQQKLLRKYKLERVSAWHTEIREV